MTQITMNTLVDDLLTSAQTLNISEQDFTDAILRLMMAVLAPKVTPENPTIASSLCNPTHKYTVIFTVEDIVAEVTPVETPSTDPITK